MFLHELTVTFGILIILIVGYHGTVFSNGLLEIGNISPMLLPCFFPESRIRIRRILEDFGIHASILFCF